MNFEFKTHIIKLVPSINDIVSEGKICENSNGFFIWRKKDKIPETDDINTYDLLISSRSGKLLENIKLPNWYVRYYLDSYNSNDIIDEIIIKFKTNWSDETIGQMEANLENPDHFRFTPTPMLNDDGTIQIKIVDNVSFNSSEIGDILERYRQHAWKHGLTKTGLKKWIKNNL